MTRGPIEVSNPVAETQAFQAPDVEGADFRESRRIAWMVAIAADFIQIVLMPIFGPGAASPLNDLLDLAVCVFMVRRLGWHPAFLPTFIAELVPVLTLIPTWTAAVWFVTRRKRTNPVRP